MLGSPATWWIAFSPKSVADISPSIPRTNWAELLVEADGTSDEPAVRVEMGRVGKQGAHITWDVLIGIRRIVGVEAVAAANAEMKSSPIVC